MRRRKFLGCVGACGIAAARGAGREEADVADTPFLLGGDVSLLAKLEGLGVAYKDGGKPKDALAIVRDRGWNCVRLRLFHTPNGEGPVCNSLDYTVGLARRVKAAGLRLLLDFHYSDTWADPGHQHKPAAWKELPFDELVRAVRAYSRDCVAALRDAGALPDVVQIGNEITPGMLWPDGRVGGKDFNTSEQWAKLGRLLNAGRSGVLEAGGRGVKIMLHVDRGGSAAGTRWFFDRIREQDVPFDLIGLSYYPWWHGTLDDLRGNLAATARRYGKPVAVVETGYHWSKPRQRRKGMKPNPLPYPETPEGQKAFLAELIATVRRTPDGLGRGVLWWAPEWIPARGMRGSWGYRTLFDHDGNALPALDAFQE